MRLQSAIYNNPNFTAMKKSQFNGVDYAVVEKFKPPIEKFDTNDDLQGWAWGKCNDILRSDLGGRTSEVYNQRESAKKIWNYALKEENLFLPTEQFLIMNGITKHLKPDDKTFMPSYNETVLNNTMKDIKSALKSNRDYNFDFGKIYRNNLKEFYNPVIDKNKCQWVVIPSKSNDRENFEKNIEKLQSLSSPHWCTKSTHAKPYLSSGDMHIYLEYGEPKLIIRMDNDAVISFYDEMNNRGIPKKYIDVVEAYIEDKDLHLLNSAKLEYAMAKGLYDTPKG